MLNGIMPFKTDNLGNLWTTQMNKDYRFRTSVIPKTSREVIDLVSTMLEPNWFERTTISEVLHSEWFALEPSLLEFTPAERLAMESAKKFQAQNLEKIIKKIMRANKAKTIIKVISKESLEQLSEDMDATRKLTFLKGITKLVNPSASNTVALKVAKEKIVVQEGRRPLTEGRRSSTEGRRASIDASLDTSISERAETGKDSATSEKLNLSTETGKQ